MSKDNFRTACREANGAPRCGGTSHMSISCCKREPTERALFHVDDAHAAVTRIVWACEHVPRTGVVCNVGWLRAWLIDRCSNKDARKSESKTPTPCPTDRQSENEKEREDKSKRKRERERESTYRAQCCFLICLCSRPPNLLDIVCGLAWFFLFCVAVVVCGSIYRFQSEVVYRHGS